MKTQPFTLLTVLAIVVNIIHQASAWAAVTQNIHPEVLDGRQAYVDLYTENKDEEALKEVDDYIRKYSGQRDEMSLRTLYVLRYDRSIILENLERNIESLVELQKAKQAAKDAHEPTDDADSLLELLESKLEDLNHYGRMQLTESATLEDLNKAHKKMQFLLHPDKQTSLDDEGKAYVAGLHDIMVASYDFLSKKMDPSKRSLPRSPSSTSTDLASLDLRAIRRPYKEAIKEGDWTKAMQTINWIISELEHRKDEKSMKTTMALYLDKARVYSKLKFGTEAYDAYNKARDLAKTLLVPIEPLESVVQSF